jgi:lycopene beta-cyclase
MADLNDTAIIAGAGLAGLALARALAQTPSATRIVVIDPTFDSPKERTWSFWGDIPPGLEAHVAKTWDRMRVAAPGREIVGPLGREPYHMIHGNDLGRSWLADLVQSPRVQLVRGGVRHVHEVEDGAIVNLHGKAIRGRWVFQSFGHEPSPEAMSQHFGGWEVETEAPSFDPGCFTLMEFGHPEAGPAFHYVLPITPHRALVEYTVFSDRPLRTVDYDAQVDAWLRRNVRGRRRVVRREYGVIPMDPQRGRQRVSPHVFRIGTAGGMTKPTTGYTFRRTLRQVDHLATTLARRGRPEPLPQPAPRFAFYDRLLLKLLREQPRQASEVFMRLFGSNRFERVFEFLDERTPSFAEARLIGSLPFEPFLRTLTRRSAPAAATRPSGVLVPRAS